MPIQKINNGFGLANSGLQVFVSRNMHSCASETGLCYYKWGKLNAFKIHPKGKSAVVQTTGFASFEEEITQIFCEVIPNHHFYSHYLVIVCPFGLGLLHLCHIPVLFCPYFDNRLHEWTIEERTVSKMMNGNENDQMTSELKLKKKIKCDLGREMGRDGPFHSEVDIWQ